MIWEILPAPQEEIDPDPLISILLYNRGVRSREEALSFLSCSEKLLGDPFLLPGMEISVHRIIRAILRGERIGIYGDFDADGLTATAILYLGLKEAGADVIPYIPSRIDEGHGLNIPAVKGLIDSGVSLIITADCGTTSIPEAQFLKKTGIDLIITDHHWVPPEPPPCLACINPKADSRYPFRELSGAGVAFKLIQAVFSSLGRDDFMKYIDLAAIGTVSDMVPLLGENRFFVKKGLEFINRGGNNEGLRALIRKAGIKELTPHLISWAVAPRLNATGRLDSPAESLNLLIGEGDADELSEILEKKNRERQRLTNEIFTEIKSRIKKPHPIIIEGGEYPPGIIGIVAGKLVDEFYRPSIVMEIGEEIRGSSRSIPEFNMIEALSKIKNLFKKFGGHPRAAGFVMEKEKLDEFREKITEIAHETLGENVEPKVRIDAEVSPTDIGRRIGKILDLLSPFGEGNPEPTFLTRNIEVREALSRGDNLVLKLKDKDFVWDAIGFSMGDRLDDVRDRIDIVYNFKKEEERLILKIIDMR